MFWTLVAIGGGAGLGIALAGLGLHIFADGLSEVVDQILRLKKGG